SDARERLIKAARDVIYANSYEAATVDDLCAVAHATKSSFYHFFSSKQDLALEAIESMWQWFEAAVLKPAFSNDLPPHEQILRFFEVMMEKMQVQKQNGGHIRGWPPGNLTLEMSRQNELTRVAGEQFFLEWLRYFEG